MNLSDYQTPITDAHELEDNGETGPVYELARDLERKLSHVNKTLSFAARMLRVVKDDATADLLTGLLEEIK